MDRVNTTLTVVNDTDVRGKAMRDLICQYITFPQKGNYGFRAEGPNPWIQYPSLFVEPKGLPKIEQVSLGHYDIKWTYAIYWYCRDNEAEQVVSQSAFIGQALIKLFSFNALDDLGAASTRQYQQYPNPSGGYYWLDSDMLSVDFGTIFLDPKASGMRFERAARMMFQIHDVIKI